MKSRHAVIALCLCMTTFATEGGAQPKSGSTEEGAKPKPRKAGAKATLVKLSAAEIDAEKKAKAKRISTLAGRRSRREDTKKPTSISSRHGGSSTTLRLPTTSA